MEHQALTLAWKTKFILSIRNGCCASGHRAATTHAGNRKTKVSPPARNPISTAVHLGTLCREFVCEVLSVCERNHTDSSMGLEKAVRRTNRQTQRRTEVDVSI